MKKKELKAQAIELILHLHDASRAEATSNTTNTAESRMLAWRALEDFVFDLIDKSKKGKKK